jgi:hypothetical protein
MEELIREAQDKGSRAAIVAYCNTDRKHPDENKQRLTHLTKAIDWSLCDSTIQNTRTGGYVEANTRYFILATKDVTEAWRSSAELGNDDAEPMEDILDINVGVFKDCNRYQTQINEQLKEVGSSHYAEVK